MASGNYHADHIGSLIPGVRRDGEPDPDHLIGTIELQREAVMDVFTDGEPWRATNGSVAHGIAELEGLLATRFDGGGEFLRLRKMTPTWARLKTTLPFPGADAVELVRDRASELLAAGVDYLQFDARNHPESIGSSNGHDHAVRPLAELVAVGEGVLSGLNVPDSATVGLYLGEAGEALATLAREGQGVLLERLFTLPVKRFLIGMSRRTDLEFLRYMPEDRFAVLGLIDASTPALEDPESVLVRMDAAAEIHGGLIAVSPSRGFADAAASAPLTLSEERKKLELVSDVARMFWGTEL